MNYPDFADILATAELHKGGAKAVRERLPAIKSSAQLAAEPDAFYLSTMSRRIFQAGLKHEMVNKRWPSFERAFCGFDVNTAALISDEELDRHLSNVELIRHLRKMKAIRINAAMILSTRDQAECFGEFIGRWPITDIIHLWLWLKQHGSQLGGMSGARFLRLAGKDTFLMTDDVVAVLKAHGIISKAPTAQRDLRQVQAVFNHWHEQTGWPMSHISRVISFNANVA